jgi:hypothetical protein
VGFSSQERLYLAADCVSTQPCAIELPRAEALVPYFAPTRGRDVLLTADQIEESKRPQFAAAVAADALQRSKGSRRPLAVELERSAKVAKVSAPDLAFHFAESKLERRCDASCLDDRSLDPEMRTYLKKLRGPGRLDPFERRTPLHRIPPP